jgi:hypothetical protein
MAWRQFLPAAAQELQRLLNKTAWAVENTLACESFDGKLSHNSAIRRVLFPSL